MIYCFPVVVLLVFLVVVRVCFACVLAVVAGFACACTRGCCATPVCGCVIFVCADADRLLFVRYCCRLIWVWLVRVVCVLVCGCVRCCCRRIGCDVLVFAFVSLVDSCCFVVTAVVCVAGVVRGGLVGLVLFDVVFCLRFCLCAL